MPVPHAVSSTRGADSSITREFLEVTPNSEMMGVFWMHQPRRLFGRQTEMILRGTKLGDIIEVIAPL